MKLVLSIIFALFISVLGSFRTAKISSDTITKIVIDPGHGGHDPGCNGANIAWEKNVTLAISLKVGKLIQDSMPGVSVIYTRKTDKFVELWERPNMANKEKADLFVSIHCNANPNTTAAGSETYFMGLHKTDGNLAVAKRENSVIAKEKNYKTNEKYGGFDPNSAEGHIIFSMYQNAFLKQSFKLSQLVENNTNKISKIKTRGVKQAGFLVLWQTSMPSILIETGFLTNPNDRAVLNSEEGQKIIAKGIYNAIKQYKIQHEKAKSSEKISPKTTSDSTANQ